MNSANPTYPVVPIAWAYLEGAGFPDARKIARVRAIFRPRSSMPTLVYSAAAVETPSPSRRRLLLVAAAFALSAVLAVGSVLCFHGLLPVSVPSGDFPFH